MRKSRHGGASDVPKGYDPSKYDRPSVTVDIILFTVHDGWLEVLLIKRKHKPCAGMWAFPGGFVDMYEGLEDAALRELKEETDLDKVYIEQLGAYGDPGRDPRTRVITVAFIALAPADKLTPRAGDDAAEAVWHPAHNPPKLAFDHKWILADAIERLQKRIWEAPVAFKMLPDCFTMTELEQVYSAVAQKKINRGTITKNIKHIGDFILDEKKKRAAPDKRKRVYYRFKPAK